VGGRYIVYPPAGRTSDRLKGGVDFGFPKPAPAVLAYYRGGANPQRVMVPMP
jgi:hypothetical protein